MPKTNDQVNLDLEDFLVSKGYDVTSLDSSGKEVPTAADGEIQQFRFRRGGKDHGTVTISIDGLKNMIVYYDDQITNSGVNEDDMDADRGMNGTSWISLVKQLKKFAQRHQLGFVLKDTDRLRTDMKRRNQTEKELRESYDGIGFSVRSDILWPSTLFESTNPKESEEFSQWIERTRKTSALPKTGNKCILAMCIMTNSGINIFYGVAKFIGETATHYVLDNGHSGENEYAKKNQLVFNSRKVFEKFRLATNLKFSDVDHPVNSEEMPVMESFSSDKQRMKLNKMFEGAELKKVKREYNQAAKNAGGDFDGAGKKIDNQKKGLRQKDIGKDKTVAEGNYDLGDRNNIHSPKETSNLAEGYYGNRKMSYSDDTPTVKMVIKHNRQLEETDQRFRHIEKIFLETSDGERFGVPTNKPSRARMFARHIAEGGAYKDDRWSHLAEICEDLDNLGGFIRATRSSDKFNESAQRMIGEAVDKYNELRGTANRLQTGRGYNSYFESYEPPVKNDDDCDLLEVFKHSSVDGRIEKAMPTLNKLGIRRGKLEEADMFEQWADDLIDESLDIGGDRQSEDLINLFANELPIGPNAEVAIGELADIIEDDDLYTRLRKAAAVDPNRDARPQIIAWMQEQNSDEYRDILDKISQDDANEEDKPVKPDDDQSASTEPAKVSPKKQESPKAGDTPELPTLSETDELMNFKRLIG